MAVCGVAQVTASAAVNYYAGRVGADSWLHANIENATSVENDTMLTELGHEAAALAASDVLRRAAVSGDGGAARAAVDSAWPARDPDDAYMVRAAGHTVAGGLPCDLSRLAAVRSRGFLSCAGTPWLAARQEHAGVEVWAAHRVDEDYADTISRAAAVDVMVLSDADVASTLRDIEGKRLEPALPRAAGDSFSAVDLKLARPYGGYATSTMTRENWPERGNKSVSMFVLQRPLGEGSEATVAMLVPVSIMMLFSRLATGASIALMLAALVLFAFFADRLIKRQLRPLADVETAARAIAEGDLNARVPVTGDLELASLAVSFNTMINKLALSRTQLLQSEKLAAIGQLAAGIAHEINTPMQYISDNTLFVERSFTKLIEQKGDVAYLREEVPKAVAEALEGIQRVTAIVRAMKDFSHPSRGVKENVGMREVLETTAVIARNEWKYVADLDIVVDDDLPRVPALRDELSQAFLNMIVNAAHAIGERHATCGDRGHIRIHARRRGDFAEIEFNDDGAGIPNAIKNRIFDPFFTTKPVGKGTGQGLAIVWSVVVDKHEGSLEVQSSPGTGTSFFVRLPLGADADAQDQHDLLDRRAA